MCGICGFVAWSDGEAVGPELLRQMCQTLRHRGPDDEGIYTVTSGCYSGSSFDVGDAISVKGTTGKWYASATGQVGVVFEFNSTKGELTIKTGARMA